MGFKTNLHKQFQTDSSKEEQGIWVDFENGVSVRIRRLSSKASVRAREEAEKPYKTRLRSGSMDDDTAELLAMHQLARGVISDWKGITEPVLDKDGAPILDEDGNPKNKDIPYSPDTAFEILSDDALKDFRTELIQISLDRDAFKNEEDADAVKNLKRS